MYWNQAAVIPSEGLELLHTTEIFKDCRRTEPGTVCEVLFETYDYFELFKDGVSLGKHQGLSDWRVDNYLVTVENVYHGYDYESHHFEVILGIEKLDQEAIAEIVAQETQIAALCTDLTIFAGDKEREVHMLGVHETQGYANVRVERKTIPLTLALSAYEATEWQLHLSEGVIIEEIILNGANQHTVVAAGNIPITDYSGPGKFIMEGPHQVMMGSFYKDGLTTEWVYDFEDEIDTLLSTFTGCPKGSEFIISHDVFE